MWHIRECERRPVAREPGLRCRGLSCSYGVGLGNVRVLLFVLRIIKGHRILKQKLDD